MLVAEGETQGPNGVVWLGGMPGPYSKKGPQGAGAHVNERLAAAIHSTLPLPSL